MPTELVSGTLSDSPLHSSHSTWMPARRHQYLVQHPGMRIDATLPQQLSKRVTLRQSAPVVFNHLQQVGAHRSLDCILILDGDFICSVHFPPIPPGGTATSQAPKHPMNTWSSPAVPCDVIAARPPLKPVFNPLQAMSLKDRQ